MKDSGEGAGGILTLPDNVFLPTLISLKHRHAKRGDTMTHVNGNTSKEETHIETHVQARLGSRLRFLRVVCRNSGVVLQGSAHTYYAKQLAQHSVMEITNLPILANEIEVC